MTIDELKLKYTDAQIAHHEYEEETGAADKQWANWYAGHMTDNGLDVAADELATLLREADAAYQNENEQYPYAQYISIYLHNHLK